MFLVSHDYFAIFCQYIMMFKYTEWQIIYLLGIIYCLVAKQLRAGMQHRLFSLLPLLYHCDLLLPASLYFLRCMPFQLTLFTMLYITCSPLDHTFIVCDGLLTNSHPFFHYNSQLISKSEWIMLPTAQSNSSLYSLPK